MNKQEIMQTLTLLVDVFEELCIPYHIGGSVASSVFGDPRATLDIDVIAAIQPGHVPLLVNLLETDYYIDKRAHLISPIYVIGPVICKLPIFWNEHY